MTKKELERIPKLHRALARCAGELDALRSPPGGNVTDTVTGSRHEMPYDKRRIVIRGTDETQARKIAERRKRKIEEFKARETLLAAELDRLEEWIASIEGLTLPGYDFADLAEIGDLVRLKYRNNMTWEEISREYYGSEMRDESYLRHKFERFLRTHNRYME
jgi:hypothetical protein